MSVGKINMKRKLAGKNPEEFFSKELIRRINSVFDVKVVAEFPENPLETLQTYHRLYKVNNTEDWTYLEVTWKFKPTSAHLMEIRKFLDKNLWILTQN